MSENQDQLVHDYKKAFGTPEGRNVLRDLARYSNAMVAVTAKFPEENTIAYTEGMRAVFWHIFGQVHDPKREALETHEQFKPVVDAFVDARKEAR